MLISLVTGRSAASEMPPDLSAPEAAVDVYQATVLMAKQRDSVAIVDVRDAEQFELYHVAGAVSKPGASAGDVIDATAAKPVVLIVASTDETAAKLAGEVDRKKPELDVHFLKEGVRN